MSKIMPHHITADHLRERENLMLRMDAAANLNDWLGRSAGAQLPYFDQLENLVRFLNRGKSHGTK